MGYRIPAWSAKWNPRLGQWAVTRSRNAVLQGTWKLCSTARLAAALALMVPIPGSALADGAAYTLGPLDRVRLKTYEWRPSRDEVFEWKALNDEFSVGAEGLLSLPLIGQIKAAGLTTEEAGRRIADAFKQRMGFAEAPSVSVEIVRFRPFYITGDVQSAGEFPFRPGLTVLQAQSIAGGFYRDPSGVRRLERESISTRSDLGMINVELIALIARRSRLEAELKGDTEIKFPADLAQRKTFSSIARLFEQEELIFRTHRSSFETEIKALNELHSFLEKQIQSVQGQLVAEDKQIELQKKEYEGIQTLMKSGLSVASRQLGLQRGLAQLDSERLKVMSQISQARQELSKTDLTIIGMRNKRANDVTIELRQTQAKIDELALKYDMDEQLLTEADAGAARGQTQTKDSKLHPTYTIVRPTPAGALELPADETTAVEPGDTVKVVFPLIKSPASSGAAAGGLNPLPSRLLEPSSDLSKAIDGLIGKGQTATE